jgi:hypothetical protein
MFSELFEAVNYTYFFISAALFLIGINTGPIVVEKNIRWLMAYPLFMKRMMEKYFKTKSAFIILFLIIFSLNNVSLFTSLLSGFLVILPPIAAFITGLNVAIISFELMGWQGIWHILVNPVAWLEFPAAWLSFAMGFRLSETLLMNGSLQMTIDEFMALLPIYFKYVFTLLLVAALLEAALIVFAEKINDGK